MGLAHWAGIRLSHLTIQLNSVRDTSVLDDLLDKHSAVSGADLGCMKGQMVDLLLVRVFHLNFASHVPFYS